MKIASGTRAPIFCKVRYQSNVIAEKRYSGVLKIDIKCPIPPGIPFQRGWHRGPDLDKQNDLGLARNVHDALHAPTRLTLTTLVRIKLA